MQFKDLPEFTQTTTIAAIIGACLEKGNNVKAAEEIRDAFIALYSEPDNSGAYDNLDSAIKDAAGSIFSKKYSEHGEHKGFISLGLAEEGKEPVIIDKSAVIAAHKTNDGVVILLRSTDKQICMSGDADMLMEQLRKELGGESAFKNMFVFAPNGIAGVTHTPIYEPPLCKVGGVNYMEVTEAPNEEIAINCNEILSIAREGAGVKITFNNGMQEFFAMDYQAAVNAAFGVEKESATEDECKCEKMQLARHYLHGVHDANVYFYVESWGMNSPETEAEIVKLIMDCVTRHNKSSHRSS
ncbi:hypothetical protein [Serratia ureilytica]|uniref:Uncharacterized protein n=1 Tax=Serratia ureilytica TaxID=300181 RepID=A0A9X9BZJ8_9GAMM|nr:hypothetical protein [Serratia ureilytica]TXE26904.1 hypothetical protein FOT63_18380 [Serratia ureilytica]